MAGATCTINVSYTPGTATGAVTGSVAITGNVAVTGSPVTVTATGLAVSYTASVTPGSLAFGSWATGTTSNVLDVTVRNTGTGALTGATFTFDGGTPQPYSRVNTGAFPANAPNCGAGLAAGASCTIKVQFAPTAVSAYPRTLTIAYAGATVTPATVTLTGSGVATRATLTIAVPTLTIAGGGGGAVTGTVTLTNASTNASDVAISNVAVSGGGFFSGYAFSASGADTCTGATLAPAQVVPSACATRREMVRPIAEPSRSPTRARLLRNRQP